MRCQSGNHEWVDPVSAERCCSPQWHRAQRPANDAADLDPRGRIHQGCGLVIGWLRLEGAGQAKTLNQGATS